MDAPGAPKEALGQGQEPATMSEEEQVAHAMQLSMAETGRGETLVGENEKEGDSPREAYKEGDNVLSP